MKIAELASRICFDKIIETVGLMIIALAMKHRIIFYMHYFQGFVSSNGWCSNKKQEW